MDMIVVDVCEWRRGEIEMEVCEEGCLVCFTGQYGVAPLRLSAVDGREFHWLLRCLKDWYWLCGC